MHSCLQQRLSRDPSQQLHRSAELSQWPVRPVSSVGSLAWFGSLAQGHAAMEHIPCPGGRANLQSSPTVKHSIQIHCSGNRGHSTLQLWKTSLALLGREPNPQPCPIVKHSFWPCITRGPEKTQRRLKPQPMEPPGCRNQLITLPSMKQSIWPWGTAEQPAASPKQGSQSATPPNRRA